MAAGLNPSQIGNLDRWGCPYLFADFRVHMTDRRTHGGPAQRRACHAGIRFPTNPR
ncbi:MAG: DUF1045 domain-containing protein [Rhizobiales bacterium]|nr:DUF1045 domain-containing protein [Hyphomicrobiales bacterium]